METVEGDHETFIKGESAKVVAKLLSSGCGCN